MHRIFFNYVTRKCNLTIPLRPAACSDHGCVPSEAKRQKKLLQCRIRQALELLVTQ